LGSADTIHLGVELHGKIEGFACGGLQGYHQADIRQGLEGVRTFIWHAWHINDVLTN
jgi:hypothetical protein